MNEPNPQSPAYRLHPEVADDLRGISAYIGHDGIDAANRVIRGCLSATVAITAPTSTDRPLLFINVYLNISVAYAQPDEDPLLIIAVLHGRRNTRLLASLLEARR